MIGLTAAVYSCFQLSLWLAGPIIKAEFYYAICFEAGSKLVADQLRTSFEPDSVMEFGYKRVGI